MKTPSSTMMLILFATLFLHLSHAQNETLISGCINPIKKKYCTTDFSVPIQGLIIDSLNGDKSLFYGKSRDYIEGFSDVLYGKDPNRWCDTLDSAVTYCESDPKSLKYNVFYPDSINGLKITCPLPFIVIFHEGSFFECNSFQEKGLNNWCRELAKRGFVVFNAEYRRGVAVDSRLSTTGYPFITAQQILGIYRACQDARGVIRTIIYRQRINDNGGDFTIDTNKLFIGGMSAGGIMALNTAYCERQGQLDSSFHNVSAALGDIDAPFYAGDTTIDYFSKIKGVVSLWGSLNINKAFWNAPGNFFDANTRIPPLIAFQGQKDSVINIGKQYMYFSPDSIANKYNINFNTETHCLINNNPFSVDKNKASEDMISLGSDALYNILLSKKIAVEEYVDSDMEHGIDRCASCTDGSFFKSDFGTGYTSASDVYSYMAGRTASFFSACMNGTASKLNKTKFVDCENFRSKCTIANNNACEPVTLTTADCREHAQ